MLFQRALVGQTYEPESLALFRNISSQPDQKRKELIDRTIRSLKRAGLWAKIDALWMMAAHNSGAAALNWKAPGSHSLSVSGSPTFTADRGYTGDGSAAYLDTNWNPSTHAAQFTQNNAHLAAWILTAVDADTIDVGMNNGSTYYTKITGRSAGGSVEGELNSASGSGAGGGNSTSAGFTILYKPIETYIAVYKNALGQLAANASASTTAPANFNLYILATNAAGSPASYSSRQVAFVSVGTSLSPDEMLQYYAIIGDYLRGVGAI